eukprot:GHVS01103229.1.p3 GENE.GHVS01103229.1~~GHVS01103229.1.p3  ORF type:complete len:131 (+),score=27.88 GHVS01103229.1:27-419(+)
MGEFKEVEDKMELRSDGKKEVGRRHKRLLQEAHQERAADKRQLVQNEYEQPAAIDYKVSDPSIVINANASRADGKPSRPETSSPASFEQAISKLHADIVEKLAELNTTETPRQNFQMIAWGHVVFCTHNT